MSGKRLFKFSTNKNKDSEKYLKLSADNWRENGIIIILRPVGAMQTIRFVCLIGKSVEIGYCSRSCNLEYGFNDYATV